MLIQVITENVEKSLIASLEAHQGKALNQNILQCRFSTLPFSAPPQDALVLSLKEHLIDLDAAFSYCQDGDLFIQWKGMASAIIKLVKQAIIAYCATQQEATLPDDFFQYYDCHVHGEELRIECRKKLHHYGEKEGAAAQNVSKGRGGENPEIKKITATFSPAQLRAVMRQIPLRKQRESPEILIVEDQAFSRKLMLSVLDAYSCEVAENGQEAMRKYVHHAPDIVFLDIELPDLDGHALANLFKNTDPETYIVMITGNHYAKDVEAAKANKVQGFIIKPYNKQKLLGSVEGYFKWINKRG
jgi:two-component system chemotaxis response regulator CheY